MKKIIKEIEDLFIDMTFAENREYAAMGDIAGGLENIFVAIAFAEEGETNDIERPRKPRKAITLKPALCNRGFGTCIKRVINMSSLVKPHKRSFLRKQESREPKKILDSRLRTAGMTEKAMYFYLWSS